MLTKAPGGCAFLISQAGSETIHAPERLSDEQRTFAETAREFVEREVVPHAAALEKQEPGLMVEKLKKAGELGLLMIDVPEEYGGLGLDLPTSMLCTEAMAAYASFSVSHGAHTGIGTVPLMYFGTAEQKQRFLPQLATGEIVAAYALTEPSSGSDAMNARTKAVKVTGEDGKTYYKLTGTKMWITNGRWADLFTVFAKIDGTAFTAFLVEAPSEGLSIGAEEHKMGIKGSSTTQVNLDGVLVPEENLLGEIGRGHKIAFNTLNIGRFKLGVGAIGGAKRTITESIRYAKERIAFNQPIANFGAIRQKIADMTTRTYALESICARVGGYKQLRLEGLEPGDPGYAKKAMQIFEEYAVEDSIIKVYGSEVIDFIADEGVQIHGGYGYSQEYAVERTYRDSRINRIFEGTNEINRMLIPGTLLKRTMKGELPLFARVQEVIGEIKADKPEPPALDAPDYAWDLFFVEAAKRLALYTANGAVQKYMTTIKDEQEILLALADSLTYVFTADSVVARVKDFGGQTQDAIARVVVAEAYRGVLDLAHALAPSLADGADLERHQATLDRFTYRCNADLRELKRVIAADMIEQETWRFH